MVAQYGEARSTRRRASGVGQVSHELFAEDVHGVLELKAGVSARLRLIDGHVRELQVLVVAELEGRAYAPPLPSREEQQVRMSPCEKRRAGEGDEEKHPLWRRPWDRGQIQV